mmetsp:Transcript_23010/g.57250  ORF Transcript_23010/g.57250 Transcript_23010/m.57250 type:complete len:321 (-) Transcript_23010:1280-2242(-)
MISSFTSSLTSTLISDFTSTSSSDSDLASPSGTYITGCAIRTPGARCTETGSVLIATAGAGDNAEAAPGPRTPARAKPKAFDSMGECPFSLSSLTINLIRSWAAFVPSTMSVRLPLTALDVNFKASAAAARSMALMCFSIFCVAGPSTILINICSEGPSHALRFSLVSSDMMNPSVRATHSPVSTKVFTNCMAFSTFRSFPINFSLTPLKIGVAPLAIRRSSMCLPTSLASSAVTKSTSLTSEGFTSSFDSARASCSAPRPTRRKSCAVRLTPVMSFSPWVLSSSPAAIVVKSRTAASAISSGVIRASSRRLSPLGCNTS